jgi:hypothetical protein
MMMIKPSVDAFGSRVQTAYIQIFHVLQPVVHSCLYVMAKDNMVLFSAPSQYKINIMFC